MNNNEEWGVQIKQKKTCILELDLERDRQRWINQNKFKERCIRRRKFKKKHKQTGHIHRHKK